MNFAHIKLCRSNLHYTHIIILACYIDTSAPKFFYTLVVILILFHCHFPPPRRFAPLLRVHWDTLLAPLLQSSKRAHRSVCSLPTKQLETPARLATSNLDLLSRTLLPKLSQTAVIHFAQVLRASLKYKLNCGVLP